MSHVRSTPWSAPAPLSLPMPQPGLAPQAGQAPARGAAATNPGAQLADAQFELAKQYGFSSWRALKAHVDSLTVEAS